MRPKQAAMVETENGQVNGSGWLSILDNEPPKFTCPVVETQLTGPCTIRGCPLWTDNAKVYCCVGALAAVKAANAEERLAATPAAQRDKRGTLRAAADGKLSFHDLASMYNISRQRVEALVGIGASVIQTLAPLFIDVSDAPKTSPTKRVGSPTLFTHAQPVSHSNGEEITRVCICCESVIEPDDTEYVIAYIDKFEVAWCSRHCNREFPIDAYLVANRYKRHWANIAMGKDPIDERSRVREITPERMKALKELAISQGYAP